MQFYCEHHENIRILHISVTLPSVASELTTLDIYDRKTLRLRHAFQSYTIALPASLLIKKLPLPVTSGLTWTFRVSADSIRRSSTNDVPLSDPAELSSLQCNACNARLVRENTSLSWRMMPSENWAEMMDSWHCHRGVSDHHHHEIHDQYALPDHIVSAAERIRARPGIGLVGSSYLLIHHTDLATQMTIGKPCVSCACGQVLGEADASECKIRKSSVWHGRRRGRHIPLIYTVADMIALLESSAVHKFIFSSRPNAASLVSSSKEAVVDEQRAEEGAKAGQESWTVWVLAPDARITASVICNHSPGMRVMKVLFRQTRQVDLQEQDAEHMHLVPEELRRLGEILESHRHIMGDSAGTGDWLPSFLTRYEEISTTSK